MRKEETWVTNMWRPAIAWSYLIICVFDFLVGPIVHAGFQVIFYPGQEFTPWKPNTLAEGGLYHMAMLTIVGVTAWTRGQEKLRFLDFYQPENAIEPVDEEEKVVKKTVKKVSK